MAFQKGQSKIGGRKKGTPNRATVQLAARIEKTLGSNPIEKMVNLAMQAEEEGDLQLAGQMLREVSLYHSPKRRPSDPPRPFTLPKQGTPTEKGEAILAAMADGSLNIEEGTRIISALQSQMKITELDELTRRIEALEDAQ